MRLLTRYVFSELVNIFALALVAFTLVVLIGVVAREALAQSLPPAQVVRLVPYVLPEALRITLPVTLLLATTTVYARMAGANEVLAVKSAGIHPMAILWPSAVLGVAVSFATVWLNDAGVAWGRAGAQRVVIESVEEIAYSMLRTQKRYASPSFSINVREVRGRRLIRPVVTIHGRGNTPAITIMAEEAELRANHEKELLHVILRNGKIDVEGQAQVRVPDVFERDIPLRDASRTKRDDRHPSSIPISEIRAEVADQKDRIERFRHRMAAQAGYEMLTGEFDALAGGDWDARHRDLERMWDRLHRLQTEPHRRWSWGFSCLCFVWVGAPMAIRLRNRDFLTSFFLCFLPILVAYYPLFMSAIDGSKNGVIPPVAIWTGNVLLALWGLWLLRRVLRY
jgi:lipopolysaccharide export system permease protein